MRIFFILLLSCLILNVHAQSTFVPPEKYVCFYTNEPINIDGQGNDIVWESTKWSSTFVNINDIGIEPNLDTKFKMLWDSTYLYFYVEMEEPHIWANLKQRDTIIFWDNDIELFLDPIGDTHNYYEIEVNANNTVWDLLLTRAYRDGGRAINNWDLNGSKFAVHIQGTLNDPTYIDDYWSVEAALPWSVLKELNDTGRMPKPGDTWRMNYSRVQWDTEVVNGKYIKLKDDKTGKLKREHNWSWSRQRVINMHEPELWGQILFTNEKPDLKSFASVQEEEARQLLYTIHRNQLLYRKNHKRFTDEKAHLLKQQTWADGTPIDWSIELSDKRYVISVKIPGQEGQLYVDDTGRNWKD